MSRFLVCSKEEVRFVCVGLSVVGGTLAVSIAAAWVLLPRSLDWIVLVALVLGLAAIVTLNALWPKKARWKGGLSLPMMAGSMCAMMGCLGWTLAARYASAGVSALLGVPVLGLVRYSLLLTLTLGACISFWLVGPGHIPVKLAVTLVFAMCVFKLYCELVDGLANLAV